MSAPTLSVVEQLQQDMLGRALAHRPFANISITAIRPRDQGSALLIQTNLDKTLAGYTTTAGANGAAILINLPSLSVPYPENPGPDLLLTYVVRVLENPVVNMAATGTQISAENLALSVLNLFHRWFVANLGSSMMADRQACQAVPSFLEQGKIVYDCTFSVKLGIDAQPATQTPKISGTAEAVTIAAADGATIYYTLDGSYPFSGNATAVLFDGNPFVVPSVPSGTPVRVVSYVPNRKASDVAFLLIK